MISLSALLIGFMLDLLIGDPPRCPHIVVGMGRLIALLERGLRRALPATPKAEFSGGLILALSLCAFSFGAAWGLLFLCGLAHPLLRLAIESLLCWQCLALRSLRDAGMKVYEALARGNLPAARLAVAQIVGRDTAALDAAGVTRAAVETVAENACDGVIAPMLFLAVGGAPLGVLYKAVNTMDSMVGYRHKRYAYFGKAAARLDDAANFIPSRLAGLLMVLCAYLLKLDGQNAWRIFRRDRYNHQSPNSAQTEAAVAGALHIRLGGEAYYFGELVHKPTLGDDDRPVEPMDICRTNRLLYGSSIASLLLGVAGKGVFVWFSATAGI